MDLHPDILAVQRVYVLDSRIDEAIASITRLEDAIRKAVARVRAGRQTRESVKAELAEVDKEEARLEKRIDAYTAKRDKTQQIIDAGQAPDFLVAQSQLQQCAAIVDDSELELLEVMEAKETIQARLAKVEAQLGIEDGRLKQARGSRDVGRPPLESLVKELRPKRAAAWKLLPTDLRGGYETLRKKKQPVLVSLLDGVCTHCHIEARAQTVIEVVDQKTAHRCRGCSGFVLDARETEPPEEELED